MPARRLAPRHRAPRSVSRSARRLARPALGLGAAGAVGALAVGVALGGLEGGAASPPAAAPASYSPSAIATQAEALIADHSQAWRSISRSELRPPRPRVQRRTKTAALPVGKQDVGGAVMRSVPAATPREIAAALLPSYGWDSSQFSCLDAIWTRESDWNPYAANASSGAYGIPQSLPGSKMGTFGSDWSTNPTTQITWGLWYIRQSYGSPCGAWAFWESHNWY